ncbi:MAG: hypothetical protein AAGK05_03335 [Pseudomonadota bacterium]
MSSSKKGSISDILLLDEKQIRDKNFTKQQLIEALISVKNSKSQSNEKEECLASCSSSALLQEINKKIDLILTENLALKEEINNLKKTVKVQNSLIEKHERELRKSNIIVRGIDEKKDPRKSFQDVLCAIQIPLDVDSECVDIHRIGKASGNKSRPIRIILRDIANKGEILRAAKYLRNFPEMKNVFIHSDLTPIQQEQERNLRKRRDAERAKPENFGKSIRISKGNLYVDNIKIQEEQNFH